MCRNILKDTWAANEREYGPRKRRAKSDVLVPCAILVLVPSRMIIIRYKRERPARDDILATDHPYISMQTMSVKRVGT